MTCRIELDAQNQVMSSKHADVVEREVFMTKVHDADVVEREVLS